MAVPTSERTLAVVRAFRIDEERRFDAGRRALREWFLESLTAVPVLCLLGAFLLAAVMRVVHRSLPAPQQLPSWLVGSTASAISVTSVIASSMLGFLAVVFSVALVSMQLASQQFSPRVLRTFVRSTVVKLVLGLASGTFAYSLLLLYSGINRTQDTVPLPAVAVDVLLVFVTIVAFVMCIKEVVTMMRIGCILGIVADETHASIRDVFPPGESYSECRLAFAGAPRQVIPYRRGRRWGLLSRPAEGVFQRVNDRYLVRLAAKHDCAIRVLPRTGEYLVDDEPALEVYGAVDLSPEACLSTFSVEPERTVDQDPACGFRALVDIALQALSPAVNAPTTGTQVIHRLTSLLLDIARRPMPTGYYADRDGVVRLVRNCMRWEEYVDLAFAEIVDFGASSSQVRESLFTAFDLLQRVVPEDYREPLFLQRERLARAAGMPAETR